MEKIKVEGVTKIFGSSSGKALSLLKQGLGRSEILQRTGQLVALNNVSFSVYEGEILVIMGLSGSGKSTLVRCLNHLVQPTAGEVWVDDVLVGALSSKELRALRQNKLGMVFQNFALFPHYSVRQNVAFGLELMGLKATKREEKAVQALEVVGLGSWGDAMPHELSGGMQQRVGLARALALNPDILLMDEAFSALDPLIRQDMQEELLRLQVQLQKTVVFISHDLDEALTIGTRIILLKDGEIMQEGTPEEILTTPANDYVAGFVKGADLSWVLTAASIMQAPKAFAIRGVDGPRTALRKMRAQGITSLFVVEKGTHALAGIITADDVLALAQDGKNDISSALQTNLVTTEKDMPVVKLLSLVANLPYPLAVTDPSNNNRLLGVIVRGSLLGALAETKKGENE